MIKTPSRAPPTLAMPTPLPAAHPQTLLFKAAFDGDSLVAQKALLMGASPWAEQRDGLTPLKAAVKSGSLECSLILAQAERDQPRGRLASASAAIALKARQLLASRPSKALDNFRNPCFIFPSSSALMIAVRDQREEISLALLDHCDARQADWHGRTPLMMAAHFGMTHLVERLLPLSDPLARDAQGRDALMFAASTGSFGCVKLLAPLSDAQTLDHEGSSALTLAAGDNDGPDGEDCVALLARLCPVDAVAQNGESALRAAARRGRSINAVALLASLSSETTLSETLIWIQSSSQFYEDAAGGARHDPRAELARQTQGLIRARLEAFELGSGSQSAPLAQARSARRL